MSCKCVNLVKRLTRQKLTFHQHRVRSVHVAILRNYSLRLNSIVVSEFSNGSHYAHANKVEYSVSLIQYQWFLLVLQWYSQSTHIYNQIPIT